MRRTILCSIASFIAALSVSAQTTWIADKAHTQITFSVTHLLISEVTGRFSDFDVTFHDANEDFTDGTIRVTIRTASINTGIEKRDNHLKSDDFLGAEKFPNITFESTLIEKTKRCRLKNHAGYSHAHIMQGVPVGPAVLLKIKPRYGEHQNRCATGPSQVSLVQAAKQTLMLRLILLRGKDKTPRLFIEGGLRPSRCFQNAQ